MAGFRMDTRTGILREGTSASIRQALPHLRLRIAGARTGGWLPRPPNPVDSPFRSPPARMPPRKRSWASEESDDITISVEAAGAAAVVDGNADVDAGAGADAGDANAPDTANAHGVVASIEESEARDNNAVRNSLQRFCMTCAPKPKISNGMRQQRKPNRNKIT